MKAIISITILLILIISCSSNKRIDRDKLVVEICQSLRNDERIDETVENKASRIMYKYIDKYTVGMPADSVKELTEFVFIRLQRECREFRDMVQIIEGLNKKKDWREVDIEPETQADKKECDDFFKTGQIKYLETNGDTVIVDITDKSWTDNFHDGTYSHLSLQRTNPEQFILTFIESNNNIRKNMSHPGDKYRYKIIKKEGNSYSMFVEVVGPSLRSLFKMYY